MRIYNVKIFVNWCGTYHNTILRGVCTYVLNVDIIFFLKLEVFYSVLSEE